MSHLTELQDEYEFLDGDDRYRLLIDLGRTLAPLPEPLTTDATLVRGCSASVWVYPTVIDDGELRFMAERNPTTTQGILRRDAAHGQEGRNSGSPQRKTVG